MFFTGYVFCSHLYFIYTRINPVWNLLLKSCLTLITCEVGWKLRVDNGLCSVWYRTSPNFYITCCQNWRANRGLRANLPNLFIWALWVPSRYMTNKLSWLPCNRKVFVSSYISFSLSRGGLGDDVHWFLSGNGNWTDNIRDVTRWAVCRWVLQWWKVKVARW